CLLGGQTETGSATPSSGAWTGSFADTGSSGSSGGDAGAAMRFGADGSETVVADLSQIAATALPLPTDPLFPAQWYLHGAFGINVVKVWDNYTGAGVKVAVFDQGVDRFHVNLDGNFSIPLSMNAQTGAIGSGSGGPLLAGDNHGTACAGEIGAERNGIGVVGVAYDSTLISEYTEFPQNTNIFLTAAVNAFNHSATNAAVMNNSWG